jgi:hypothetical protein
MDGSSIEEIMQRREVDVESAYSTPDNYRHRHVAGGDDPDRPPVSGDTLEALVSARAAEEAQSRIDAIASESSQLRCEVRWRSCTIPVHCEFQYDSNPPIWKMVEKHAGEPVRIPVKMVDALGRKTRHALNEVVVTFTIGDTTHVRSYGAVGDYGHNDSKYDKRFEGLGITRHQTSSYIQFKGDGEYAQNDRYHNAIFTFYNNNNASTPSYCSLVSLYIRFIHGDELYTGLKENGSF